MFHSELLFQFTSLDFKNQQIKLKNKLKLDVLHASHFPFHCANAGRIVPGNWTKWTRSGVLCWLSSRAFWELVVWAVNVLYDSSRSDQWLWTGLTGGAEFDPADLNLTSWSSDEAHAVTCRFFFLTCAELPGQLPQQRRDGVCGSHLPALPDGHRLPPAGLPGAGPADGADIRQLLPQVTEGGASRWWKRLLACWHYFFYWSDTVIGSVKNQGKGDISGQWKVSVASSQLLELARTC